MLGPKNPASSVCWCLSHRIDARTNQQLVELPFARTTKIPHVDDLPVWSAWCIRVRPGHRGEGIAQPLLDGAVAYALAQGAPAVEGYPVDNQGAKVDLTMAYVGTHALFERADFARAADTDSVSGGFPRVLMRWSPTQS